MKSITRLLLIALSARLSAQTGWRLVRTSDELTGVADRRLMLRADTMASPADTLAHRHRFDALALVCGERLPSSAGRSLVLFTDESWQQFGAATGYADLRFDGRPEAMPAFVTLIDYGVIAPTGHVAARHMAFLGSESSPYFSRAILTRLLSARTLSVTYRAVGANETLRFHVGELKDALGQLPGCRWSE